MTIHLGYDHLSLDELAERFRGEPEDAEADEERAAAYYMDIGCALAKHGDAGIALLLAEVAHVEGDERKLRGVLAGLAYQPLPAPQYAAARPIFQAHLADSRELVVLDAIEGLAVNRDTAARDAVLPLRAHPSAWVRGAVLRYVQRCFPNEAAAFALAALTDDHYIVLESAIDVLDELGAVREYLDRIRPFLEDAHPDVRAAAQWAIEAAEETDDENEEEADSAE